MNEERFSRIRIPVHKIPHGADYRKAFPSLLNYPEFNTFYQRVDSERNRNAKNAVIRYIIYLYDYQSDLVDEHPTNIQERKEAAAEEAGFNRNKVGKYGKTIEHKLFSVRDEEVFDMILRFLKVQNSQVWRNIVVTEQELEEFQRLRFQSLEKKGDKLSDKNVLEAATKKQTLMEACDSRIEKLENLYKKFYRDHRDLMDKETIEMITPENALRLLKEEMTDVLSN